MPFSFATFRNVASALIGLGGAFFFAMLGGTVAIGLSILLLKGPSSSSGGFDGFGLAIAGLMLLGAGLVVGFALGIPFMAWIGRQPKLLSLSIAMAILGYAGAGTGLFYYSRMHRIAKDATVEIRARADARKQHLAQYDAENQRRAKTALPPLLQDLFYPGAEIVDGGVGPDYDRVILSVREPVDTVRDYYVAKVPDLKMDGGALRGKTRRPGDGRMVDLEVFRTGSWSRIAIVLDVSDYQERSNAAQAAAQGKNNNSSPTDSPPQAATEPPPPLGSVFDSDPSWVLASTVEELNTAYGNFLYPGSHTNFPSTTHPRPDVPGSTAALATTDSLETVAVYYRPLVTIQRDQLAKFVGTATRADGRTAFIDLSRKGDLTFIGLSAR